MRSPFVFNKVSGALTTAMLFTLLNLSVNNDLNGQIVKLSTDVGDGTEASACEFDEVSSTSFGTDTLNAVARNSTHVFWIENGCNKMARTDAGGGLQDTISTGINVADIDAHASFIFAIEKETGDIYKINNNSGIPSFQETYGGPLPIKMLKSYGGVIYVLGEDGVVRDKSGTMVDGLTGINAFDFSDGVFYCVTDNTILRKEGLNGNVESIASIGGSLVEHDNVNDDVIIYQGALNRMVRFAEASDSTFLIESGINKVQDMAVFTSPGGDGEVTFSIGSNAFKFPNRVVTYDTEGVPNNNILPVEFGEFTVEQNGKQAEIAWSTYSETNNSHFEIEMSRDGKSFSQIGRIDGLDNSDGSVDYSMAHTLDDDGLHYYRIKQVDHDGNSSHSTIKTLDVDGLNSDISIFPNPTNNILFVRDNDLRDNDHRDLQSAKIYDMSGALVLSKRFNANAGSATKIIDVNKLKQGMYSVEINTGSNRYVEKLVINR